MLMQSERQREREKEDGGRSGGGGGGGGGAQRERERERESCVGIRVLSDTKSVRAHLYKTPGSPHTVCLHCFSMSCAAT